MKRAVRSNRRFFTASGLFAATIAVAAVQACGNSVTISDDVEHHDMKPIVRASFAHDRLWLLHLDGTLASLKPSDAKPQSEATTGKVIEICKSAGKLLALLDDGRDAWSLQQYSPAQWSVRATLPAEGDTLVAIDCNGSSEGVTLVTNRRLLEVEGQTVRSVKLMQELRPPLVNGTALAAGDAIWVGFNVGEWGGGLRRISRNNGNITTVEQNRSGNLCGGPLNSDCDPVNGLVGAPWDRTCVVAAIGLVHMMSHGRIVEVCNGKVRRLYFKPLDPQPPRGTLDDGEPSSTVAFYGLTRADNMVWAIGIDGIYRFAGNQAPKFQPLPKFHNRGGYWVSFDIPDIALVMTDVNRRASMSGAVPIMAAR